VLSSMMLHHLDADAKTAAEVFRVLRPGGRLHLVDMGGDMTAYDGLAAGFGCTEVATQRHRFVGRLTYYRATRPA
jgi:SAM-dependent methyltransferase